MFPPGWIIHPMIGLLHYYLFSHKYSFWNCVHFFPILFCISSVTWSPLPLSLISPVVAYSTFSSSYVQQKCNVIHVPQLQHSYNISTHTHNFPILSQKSLLPPTKKSFGLRNIDACNLKYLDPCWSKLSMPPPQTCCFLSCWVSWCDISKLASVAASCHPATTTICRTWKIMSHPTCQTKNSWQWRFMSWSSGYGTV